MERVTIITIRNFCSNNSGNGRDYLVPPAAAIVAARSDVLWEFWFAGYAGEPVSAKFWKSGAQVDSSSGATPLTEEDHQQVADELNRRVGGGEPDLSK